MLEHQSRRPVSLRSIVEELDARPGEASTFLDLETGACTWFYDEVLGAVQDGTEPPPDEYVYPEDLIEAARVLDDPDRFRKMPSPFEIDEWQIMHRFVGQLGDQELAGVLAETI
ncbi:MAG: hypothetical protein FJY85_22590, partial [Deltaproteobacteria bacterium]|nr:hypothetical protein [Deltaproteobacteria bacterium]